MKILTSQQIRNVDTETIKREAISSLELMKRASTAFYNWFIEKYSNKHTSVLLFSGIGNNGGDGLVIARLLYKSGYNVKVCVVEYSNRYSEDCVHNLRRAKAENISIIKIADESQIPDISKYDVIIDGIFGTGLSREVSGIAESVIKRINDSGITVLSIDVPSGLFLERKTTFAVKAAETVTFQIPKLALFLPENHLFTGNVTIIDIGLNKRSISETESYIYFTEKQDIRNLLKPLSKFAHKGTEGHVIIIGGSLGKCGSVCLSTKAALKTGCGLVTAYLPKCGMQVIQINFPEAMAIEDNGEKYITSIDFEIKPDAIGLGIGMGQNVDTQKALHDFLISNNIFPLVIDADGLNILAKNQDWLKLLQPNTILTPHPGELSRLIGEWSDDYDKIQKTRLFAQEYNLIVVVKGAYTLIIDSENIYVNSSGTPALATAGSGDVLTGMITSLLAQGYKPIDAARVGVYLHGITSDMTMQTIHPRSFIASDIIENIGNAYSNLEKDR
ncbi:MAG: NAD(P)H-hydrate dehydratase [Fermentimonas sp.]|nr:NAD(P)H-hydrate dehydratase [Fermentimonas sp.]